MPVAVCVAGRLAAAAAAGHLRDQRLGARRRTHDDAEPDCVRAACAHAACANDAFEHSRPLTPYLGTHVSNPWLNEGEPGLEV